MKLKGPTAMQHTLLRTLALAAVAVCTLALALPVSEVQKQFGEAFAVTLSVLEPGQWQGPIASGYGVHLVFVHTHVEGRLPALEEVRDAVHREWATARRLEA